MPKGYSGINRGVGVKTPRNADITYNAIQETDEEVRQRLLRYEKTQGHRAPYGMYLPRQKNPEAV